MRLDERSHSIDRSFAMFENNEIVVFFTEQKILLYLPELVHKRWQFHSLGRIMQKLLHHGNALKVSGNNLSNLYKFYLQSYSYKPNYYFFG